MNGIWKIQRYFTQVLQSEVFVGSPLVQEYEYMLFYISADNFLHLDIIWREEINPWIQDAASYRTQWLDDSRYKRP